ncbi:MAG: AI-2E family transporter [Nitrospinota bacterium]
MRDRSGFRWEIAAVVVASLAVAYWARAALFPFFIAFILAYLLDPLLDRMEAVKINRTAGVVFLLGSVFVALLLAGFIIYPLLEQQLTRGIELLPRYAASLQDKLAPFIEKMSGYDKAKADEMIQTAVGQMGSLPLRMVQALYGVAASTLSTAAGFVSTLFGFIVVPVATFYFMRDIDPMKDRILGLVPERYRGKAEEIVRDVDIILSAFVRGQLTVALALAFLYALGLYLIGTPMGLFIGILAGLSNIVPYLPLVTGLLPALVMTYLEFGDFTHILYVLLLFGGVQLLEGFLLTPRIVGESVGLHPVAVLFAVLIGGMFFGIVGLILAVPAAAVLKVLWAHAEKSYRSSDIFNRKK